MLYLTDADVQSMFLRACEGLKPDGYIFVKENVCKEGFIVDNDDSSLTRSNAYYKELFEKSNMQVLCDLSSILGIIFSQFLTLFVNCVQLLQSAEQKNFPKDLFDVWMYVLRPRPKAAAP